MSAATDPAIRTAFHDRPVLVIGASGFIGRRVCDLLREAGARVVAVARRGAPAAAESVRVEPVDAGDLQALEAVYVRSRPDIVYQLAGHVTGRQALDEVLPALHGNLLTTVNALILASRYGCRRFLIAASLEEPAGVDGDSPAASPYGTAKLAARVYADFFRVAYRLPVALARVFLTYGPGQVTASKLIPYAIHAFLDGQVPRIESEFRLIDWIYIDDVARGLLRLAVAEGLEGRMLDIGSGQTRTVGEVVDTIGRLIGSPVRAERAPSSSRRNEVERKADIRAARELLGWEPTIELEEGLRRTIEWHRAMRKRPS